MFISLRNLLGLRYGETGVREREREREREKRKMERNEPKKEYSEPVPAARRVFQGNPLRVSVHP